MAYPVRRRLIEVSAARAAAFRARRHLLDASADRSAVEVAGRVFGLHAQVHSCAGLMWSARSRSAARAGLERLLWEERALVKGWFMRGTLHLLPAADYRLHGSARAEELPRPSWLEYFEITPAEYERLMEAVPAVLSAEPVTRRELVAAVRGEVPEHLAKRLASGWGTLLKPLVRRGLLCFGPPRGQEATFVRASAWLGDVPSWEPDEAVAELARRYLSAFAPASRADFERWAGIEARRGRVAWTRLGEEIAEVLVDGRPRSVLGCDLEELAASEPEAGVRLLGGFDTLLIGHRDRDHLGVPTALRPRVWREAGWISPVLLVGGRVAGVWSHSLRGRSLVLRVEPFAAVARSVRKAVDEEAERVASYLGGVPRVDWAA